MTSSFPARSSQQPASSLIIGRERELGVLRQRLDTARAGQGGLVLIGGEAGIGKTTLVEWLAAEAMRDEVAVFRGYCYELTLTPPYGAWVEAIAGVSVESQPVSPAALLRADWNSQSITSRSALFDRIHSFLVDLTATHPVVLVLEDLHWSDPASLELLRVQARSIHSLAVLIVATYRADELTRDHPFYRLLPSIVRESHAARLELQPLTDDDVQALIRARYALSPRDESHLVAYLRSRVEGNPFYLSEVLRTLEAERHLLPGADRWSVQDLDHVPVPPLVRQTIEERLAWLDVEDRRLLEIAAAIGQGVPINVWLAASMTGNDQIAATIQRAIGARVFVEPPEPARVRFTHALVRETLYEGMAVPERKVVHRRIAEILADQPDPIPRTIASHFVRADDPRAIGWLTRDGVEALAVYAAEDAVAAINQAQDLAVRFDEELPLGAYRTRAAAHVMLGEFDEARRDHEVVRERGRMRNDTRAEWQALLDLGMLWAERDYDRTGEHYRAALAIARVAGDASMTAYSLNRIANWHVNRDAPASAIPLHQEALSIFEAIDDRQGIAYTLDFLGVASFVDGDWPASQRYYERAIGLLRQLGDQQRLSSSLSTMIVSGGTLSRDVAAPVYREAAYWLRHSDEGISLARSIGWAAGESYGLINRSLGTAVRGDLGRSLRDACAALATAERIEHGLWTIFARYAVGVIRTELLDTERAAADIEQALAEARVSRTRIFIVAAATALATLRFDEGRLDQAEAILETAIRQDELQPSITQRGCWFVQARLELARGKPDRALAIVERLDRLSRSATTGHAVPHLMFLRGAALEMLGRHSAADASYQAARDSAALFGFLPILWRIDAARGGLFRVAGRDSDASAAYSAARDTVDAIAASIDDDAVRTRFRTHATARLPDRDADVRPAGLSPRELEVLRLVAEGRTDQEIANVLFISRRTVHRHVTAILNKTGTRTRTSAAALAIRLGIV